MAFNNFIDLFIFYHLSFITANFSTLSLSWRATCLTYPVGRQAGKQVSDRLIAALICSLSAGESQWVWKFWFTSKRL